MCFGDLRPFHFQSSLTVAETRLNLSGEAYVYRSVPHIRPLFCNLSASRKRRGGGGLYTGSDILSREYAPSSDATPRCWHRNRLIEAANMPSLLILLSPEPQKLVGQDRLTEVGHRVDSGVFQAICGFVLSMCCRWLTLLTNTLAIDGKFLSCSMDAGFILALPQGPWTWQCRSFNKDHFGRMAMVGGPICEIKIPVQEL